MTDPSASITMSSNQLNLLMKAISDTSTAVDQKLSHFKEDIDRGQAEVVGRVTKKARREKAFEFTKRGNQYQHEFNSSIADVLEDAQQEAKAIASRGILSTTTEEIGREVWN